MAIDEELGLVYLPVETPSADFYGGHRPGQQSVRREPGRRRAQDRQAPLALPARPPSDLEHGHRDARRFSKTSRSAARRSRPCRSWASRRWSTSSIASPDSRCGRSKSARCRKATCPARRRHRRSRSRPRPPPYDHQGVTPESLIDFTPAAARRSAAVDVEIQDGPDLHADGDQQGRRSDRIVPIVGRHELARRRVRSGNAGALRAVVHVARAGRTAAAAQRGVLRHSITCWATP